MAAWHWGKTQPVEPHHLRHFQPATQMTDMHRIEGSAQYAMRWGNTSITGAGADAFSLTKSDWLLTAQLAIADHNVLLAGQTFETQPGRGRAAYQ